MTARPRVIPANPGIGTGGCRILRPGDFDSKVVAVQ